MAVKRRTVSKRKVVSKKRTNSKRKVVSKKRTNSKRKTNSKKKTNSKRKTLSKKKIKRGGERDNNLLKDISIMGTSYFPHNKIYEPVIPKTEFNKKSNLVKTLISYPNKNGKQISIPICKINSSETSKNCETNGSTTYSIISRKLDFLNNSKLNNSLKDKINKLKTSNNENIKYFPIITNIVELRNNNFKPEYLRANKESPYIYIMEVEFKKEGFPIKQTFVKINKIFAIEHKK